MPMFITDEQGKPIRLEGFHRASLNNAWAQAVCTQAWVAVVVDRFISRPTALIDRFSGRPQQKVRLDYRDVGPTGKLIKPLGDLEIEEAEEAFFRQAQALVKGGADVISIETMFSLEEALAALRGAKRLGHVPVIAALTYNRTKKGFFTVMGEGVSQAVSAFENAGADVIAANCTLGSRDMIDLTGDLRAATARPLLIQPNAGKPSSVKGVTTYHQTPAEFAQDGKRIREAGANMVGGCCGTSPDFIKELARALSVFP